MNTDVLNPAQLTAQVDAAYTRMLQPTFRRFLQQFKDRTGRVYVAGPMTGLPDFNYPAFHAAAAQLRAQGLHVENPAEHGNTEGADWEDYVRYDLGRLATCSAIYLLPGWENSKGAQLEVHVARTLEMFVMYAPGAMSVLQAELRQKPAPVVAQKESPTAGMNIAERILHVGGRNNAAGYVEFGSIQAVQALVRQVLRDLPAAPQPSAQAPAVPAWKDNDTAKLVNDLRDVAIKYHNSQQLRERIAQIVRPIATLMAQAPAVPSQTFAPRLLAMASNYADGHAWDKLDGYTCRGAAQEIAALRTMLAAAPQPEAQAPAVPAGIDAVLDAFGNKERGIPQAHIAAALVKEMRAALAAPQPEAQAVKPMGYGGSTGINDYLMNDGTIKAMRPDEVVWAAPQPDAAPTVTEPTTEETTRAINVLIRAGLLRSVPAPADPTCSAEETRP
jgi:hypothetical protein